MTRGELKKQANERFGRLLRSIRARSGKGLGEVAAALNMTEFALKRVEARPAELPCCVIYRIVEFFGPDALFEAEVAFQEIERFGRCFRASQKQLEMGPTVVSLRSQRQQDLEDAAAQLGLEIAAVQRDMRKEAITRAETDD